MGKYSLINRIIFSLISFLVTFVIIYVIVIISGSFSTNHLIFDAMTRVGRHIWIVVLVVAALIFYKKRNEIKNR